MLVLRPCVSYELAPDPDEQTWLLCFHAMTPWLDNCYLYQRHTVGKL